MFGGTTLTESNSCWTKNWWLKVYGIVGVETSASFFTVFFFFILSVFCYYSSKLAFFDFITWTSFILDHSPDFNTDSISLLFWTVSSFVSEDYGALISP